MPGVFVLSLDAEIAWGTYSEAELARRAGSFDRFPGLFRQLLDRLEQYRLPATWAFVGHLMVPPGARVDVRRPRYSFASLPDGKRAPRPEKPHWFSAPDFVRWVQSSPVRHELATHTFTHLLADDPGVDEPMWRDDLRRCVELAHLHGFELRSIVFPQNRVCRLSTLADFGLVCYRGVERSWFQKLPGVLRKVGHLVHRALAWPAPTYPLDGSLVEGDLVNLPASQLLLPYDGARSFIPTWSRRVQAIRGLRQAARRRELFHLWFHPFNLASSPRMWQLLEEILQEAAELRQRGDLRVMTMGDLARELLSSREVSGVRIQGCGSR